jgi:2-polyprenyl-3-methyl-5-hydroxy-6-metoxy-1,4-benzoquinol methylase
VQTDSRILEVGSGSGSLLLAFAELGFSHLLGVDQYIERSVTYPSGVTILKQSLEGIRGNFDLIMLHHVFEHMPDSRTVLQTLTNLLTPEGCILIRTPVSDSFASITARASSCLEPKLDYA